MLFRSQAAGDKIQVFFNGSGIHSIAGPVPFVKISKSFNNSEAGILQSIVNKVILTGKIVKTSGITDTTPGEGTSGIISAINSLENLFSASGTNNNYKTFEIKCGSSSLLKADGVKVNSVNIDKSNDNWIFSADYNIELEYYTSISGFSGVKKGSDSWSLEPLEEYIYTAFSNSVTTKAEYYNPRLKPTAPTTSVPVPGAGANPAAGTASNAGSADLQVLSIPRFKLSRKLTAEGVPTFYNGLTTGNYSAYLNAKAWIAQRLADPFAGAYGSGGPTFNSSAISSLSNFSTIFLYNHLRTVNFSETEGTYEVNDTWLAMPNAIRYTEDYTIETSTDNKFIRTVRVQGSINGLSMSNMSVASGGSGLIPNSSGLLDLSFANSSGTGSFLSDTSVPDLSNSTSPSLSSSAAGSNTSYDGKNFYGAKYLNAMSGWTNDIKPYLYRRAHLPTNLTNIADRTVDYVNPATAASFPPSNPIYCKSNVLNPIPISTSETHDPRKGSINYSYEFNNKFTFISGVLAENITVNDTGPTDVINEAFVLGRALGPVLQNLGTVTSAKKDLTFEVFVVPPSGPSAFFMTQAGCPLWTGGTVYQAIIGIIEGFKPFGARNDLFGNTRSALSAQVYLSKDDHSWNPTEGHYTRQVSWTYQTCNISRSWMDH